MQFQDDQGRIYDFEPFADIIHQNAMRYVDAMVEQHPQLPKLLCGMMCAGVMRQVASIMSDAAKQAADKLEGDYSVEFPDVQSEIVGWNVRQQPGEN